MKLFSERFFCSLLFIGLVFALSLLLEPTKAVEDVHEDVHEDDDEDDHDHVPFNESILEADNGNDDFEHIEEEEGFEDHRTYFQSR